MVTVTEAHCKRYMRAHTYVLLPYEIIQNFKKRKKWKKAYAFVLMA